MADVPFLGSKISLISKSDIRYEGILFSVDAKESTIALSKVKSFGTEGREGPAGMYVAPKNDIFDIIIFRASDVKDLRVDAPEPPGLSDPAIISAHHSLPAQANLASKNQTTSSGAPKLNSNGSLPIAGPSNQQQKLQHQQANQQNQQNQQHQKEQHQRQPHLKQQQQQYQPKESHQRQPQQQHQRPVRRGGSQDRQPRNDRQDRPERSDRHERHERHDRHENHVRYNYPRRGGGGGGGGGQMYQSRGPMRGGRQLRSNDRRDERNGPRNGTRGGGGGGPRGPRKAPTKFEGEYDFDKANKLFLELEGKFKGMNIKDGKSSGDGVISKSTAGQSESGSGYDSEDQNHKDNDSKDGYGESVSGEFYDKTKSFFDNISCEASVRSQGKVNKPDWRKERQMNAETFGVSANYRRGGYRGRTYRTAA